jgi:hypothetical protein
MSEQEEVKLIGLQIYGLRKIRAFSMAFAENGMTVIAGRNRQGKTSALNAIEILLKGLPALPKNAVNNESEKLEIIGQLGDYTIRRIFNKNREQTTLQVRKGDLSVNTKPQAFLDTFINEISFNPMPFLSKKPEEKMKFLMEYAGIDFATIDAKISTLESERQYIGREVKSFGEIILPEKVEPVSILELQKQLDEIDIENKKRQDEYDAKLKAELEIIASFNREQNARQDLINYAIGTLTAIEKQIETVRQSLTDGFQLITNNVGYTEQVPLKEYEISILEEKELYLLAVRKTIAAEIENFTQPLPLRNSGEVKIAEPELMPKDEIRKQIADSEEINLKAKAYTDANTKLEQKQAKETEYSNKTAEIEKLRADKKKMLLDAELPVEGLELREDGVYYNDVYSENWSGSESWIISAQLCMSRNPKLKSVFYDGGELMDSDCRKAVNDWCVANGIQFIITKVADEVGETDEPNVFYIEEGEVVDTPAAIESKEKAKEIFDTENKPKKAPVKISFPAAKKENPVIQNQNQFENAVKPEDEKTDKADKNPIAPIEPDEKPEINETPAPPVSKPVDPLDLFDM